MEMVLNTNVASLIAQRRLTLHSQVLNRSLERLSSGHRINRAADDAAGLTISQNLASQVRRLDQASQNTQEGINVLQIAEGSLAVINDNLQRVRELAVQAANDSYDANSRDAITNEIKQLLEDINRIASASSFNGTKLLNGSATNALIQVGANSDANTNTVNISSALIDASIIGLGVVGGTQTFASLGTIDLSSAAAARGFMSDLNGALSAVNSRRSLIGAFQNKLESVYSNLELSIENISQANSQIRDVDVAEETSVMAQAQVLQNAATIVLGQTNRLSEMILGLLQK